MDRDPAGETVVEQDQLSAPRAQDVAKRAGLSKGAYTTMLWIQCASCLPQTLQIPVTLVIGHSSTTTIGGVAHGASFKTAFAPGMVLSVFGTQLAPSTGVALSLPLPLVLNGVSRR